MKAQLKVAVVGLGIGREHLRHWQSLPDQYEVSLVCDTDADLSQRVADQLGCQGVTHFDAVLDSPVDIIDICTPPHLHADMAKRALASGHHVVCEKPLVNSLKAVDELIAAEAAANRILMPVSQYRFAGGVQRLKYLVDQGLVGQPYISSVETHWYRGSDYYASPWRGRWDTEHGGVILCHALHLHDLLCFILGDVQQVYAQIATRVNPIETEDCATISLKMRSGALVSSSATLGSRQQISRLRFCFEHLTAESNLAPYDPGRDPWTFTASTSRQDARITEALRTFVPPAGGFTGQFMGLYTALQQGIAPPVGLPDARRSLELVTAIYASASHNQVEVLPIDEQHPGYSNWQPRGFEA